MGPGTKPRVSSSKVWLSVVYYDLYVCSSKIKITISLSLYRVRNKFSDTLDMSFVGKWLTWIWSLLKTKLTFVTYPHILKISLASSRYGFRYSHRGKPRSKSKFTHQFITDSCYLIAVLLDCFNEINGFWKVINCRTCPASSKRD